MGSSEKRPQFGLKELQEISESNIKDSVSFFEYQKEWLGEEGHRVSSNVSLEQLTSIVLDPSTDSLESEAIDLNGIDLDKKEPDDEEDVPTYLKIKSDKIKRLIRQLEAKKQEILNRNIYIQQNFGKSGEDSLKGKYDNVFISNSIDDGVFEDRLRREEFRAVLLVTDTSYTLGIPFYRKIIKILEKNKIPYAEYTNIQPKLDRRLIFRIAEFAQDHDVNGIIVIGSMSTIDLLKLVLPNITKPHILRLHRSKEDKQSLLSNHYTLFSIPTLVVPEEKVNSRSALRNNVLFPKFDFFGDVVFLNNAVENSDAVFYCTDIFDELSKDKLFQVLHETFFRLILNYFDLSASPKMLSSIVANAKKIEYYLEYTRAGQDLNLYDKTKILEIVASTMDGRTLLDVSDFWIWFRLEGSLSLLTNSKKSDGLALFLPTYLEVLSKNSIEFNKRAIELATQLFDSYSVEGLIYKLILHIKRHNLPISFLDIPNIKKIDYKFMITLIKKASNGAFFNKLTKLIIKNLTVW